ncbi:MAG TPA: ATP-binding protein [Bryobacteraceae bacterium]|nr:ATP-binding protein [Bryobacteraceae bacterium]
MPVLELRTIELLTLLTGDPEIRPEAARSLAEHLGAAHLLFFVSDPELGAPLPPLGFPQTLHGGRCWRAFVQACLRNGTAQGELFHPTALDRRTARGWSAPDQTVLVLLDGEPHHERVAQVQCLLPFLGAVFRRERLSFAATGQAQVARVSAAQAKELATALDSVRAELQLALDVQHQQIIERKKAEAELAKANAALERFAHTAAHDLQEPLRTVTTYAQLLSRQFKASLTGDGLTFINFITDGAQRMHALIRALLNYAEASSTPIVMEPVDIEVCLRSAAANLKVALDEAGATLTNDALPAVQGDATQLVQLFQNLLSNAIKYRSPAAPCIHISAQSEENIATFSIRDNGIGISSEHHENIFVSFTRLHGNEYPGTGLGLASCRRIVERHGGRIWVQSGVAQGSTFYFTLALAGAMSKGQGM